MQSAAVIFDATTCPSVHGVSVVLPTRAAVAAPARRGAGGVVAAPSIMRCQVPGCTVDLRTLSESNQRCHTCVEHSRADHVVIDGAKFRFCQQCNKYQPLSDFEAKKRACREKLAIHNRRRVERRRKNAQRKDIALALVDGVTKSKRSTVVKKLEADVKNSAHENDLNPASLLLPSSPGVGVKGSPAQGAAYPDAKSGAKSPRSVITDAEGRSAASSDAESFTWSHCPENMQLFMQRNQLTEDLLSEYLKPQVAASRASDTGRMQSKPIQYTEPNYVEPQQPGHPEWQSNPHDWQMQSASQQTCHPFNIDPVRPHPATARSQAQNRPAPDQLFEIQSSMLYGVESDECHICMGAGCNQCCQPVRCAPRAAEPFSFSTDAMQQGYCQEPLPASRQFNELPQCNVARLSMKLDHATPRDLPTDFFSRVTQMFAGYHDQNSSCELMGYIRPGCLHITVDVPIERDAVLDARAMQERAQRALLGDAAGWDQFGVDVVLPGGRVKYSPASGTSAHLPSTQGPEVVMVQMATANNTVKASVRNWLAYSGNFAVHCRLEGHYVPVTVVDAAPMSDDVHCLTLELDCADIGMGWIEIVNDDPHNFYVSSALPVLISDNATVCEEISQLTNSAHLLAKAEAVGVLKDADSVLGFDERGVYCLEACGRLAKVAARCGWSATVQECIDLATDAMDVQQMLDAWPELLLQSVQSGNVQTVAQVASCYVMAEAPLPLAVHDSNGLTPLHWAAMIGDLAVIDMLRQFDAEDGVWHGVTARCAPNHTPAQMLHNPQASGPEQEGEELQAAPAHPQQAAPDSQERSADPASPAKAHVPLISPLLLLAALVVSRGAEARKAVIVAALLGVVLEYCMRYLLPQQARAAQLALLQRFPSAADKLGSAPGSLRFDDPALEQRYHAFWQQCRVQYEPLILGGIFLKSAGALMRHPSMVVLWVLLPGIFMTLHWILRRRQSLQWHEMNNLALQALGWTGFCVAKSVDTAGATKSPLTCVSVAVPLLISLFLGAQYCAVWPVRMRRQAWVMAINFLGAFASSAITLITARTATPELDSCGPALRCIALAVVPALGACLGAGLSCARMEQMRLGQFMATLKKSM